MKKLITLFLILLLAVFLRFWHLGQSPPGVLVDEAAMGYNAYSILKTGQDEWGERFPIVLHSFGDFQPAGYSYLAMPFIKLFGLSPFSVRLPSAIFGVISIISLYLIVLLLLKDHYLALLSSFFLTISPWHINMSRMAWEVNAALGLFLLGLTFFCWGLTKGYPRLFVAAVFFSLSTYTYVGYRLLVPLFLLFMVSFFLKKKIITIKRVLVFLFIAFFLNLPFIPKILSPEANLRFSRVSIANNPGVVQLVDEQRNFCGFSQNNFLLKTCYLIWNKPTVISLNFLRNYLATISPDFLFLRGEESKFINNPNHGGMYIWFLPLFFLGLVKSFYGKSKLQYQFFFWWFLIPPLMSAVAGPPQFGRSNMVFIPATVLSALGVYGLLDITKRFKPRNLLSSKTLWAAVLVGVSAVSLLAAEIDYFFIYTKKAMAWDEYYPQVYSFLKTIDKGYQTIYFHKLNGQPYIYMLFYESLEPNFFRETVRRDNNNVLSVGKYQFVDFGFSGVFCRWQNENKPKTLLVTDEDNLWPQSIAPQPLLTVKSANGVHVLALVYDIGKTVDDLESKKIDLPGCLPPQGVK